MSNLTFFGAAGAVQDHSGNTAAATAISLRDNNTQAVELVQNMSMEELQQTVEEDNSVLAPAFQLQRMLRQRILGVRYWEQETLRRQTYFAGYDSGTTTSWDAIRDILAIKHRERLEEEERQRRLKEMEEEQRRQEKLQKELKFKEEMARRRRPNLASRRRGASFPRMTAVGGFICDFE